MHAQQVDRLSAHHDDVGELLRLLGRLRWRLGLEQVLRLAVRGAIASSLALMALSVAGWVFGIHDIPPWFAVAPLVASVLFGIVRWPSPRRAALVADQRLALEDRLATAVELTDGRPYGRFDALQIRDALGHASRAPQTWLALDTGFRNEALIAVGALGLAAASLLLPGLPRPVTGPVDARPLAIDTAPAVSEVAERTLPDDASDLARASTQPVAQAQSDANLAARVQQEQSQREALDALAHALGSVSAGQQAADAIQQGNYATARDQLQALGEQADQLSDAAKQQLSRALQQAAATTAQTDRQLADKERQAAQALSRTAYREQRQALRSLADQVERSGARAVPADQLQRDLGRLQAQTAGSPQDSAASGSGAAASRGSLPGSAPGSSSAAGQAGGPGAGPAAGAGDGARGQPGGAGVGTGSDPNLYGNASRLDTAGQQVQVPTKLGGGAGVRPPDGSEDQTGADPSVGGQRVSEASQAQSTGQVAPEQNLVPGEQRPVVRGYFR